MGRTPTLFGFFCLTAGLLSLGFAASARADYQPKSCATVATLQKRIDFANTEKNNLNQLGQSTAKPDSDIIGYQTSMATAQAQCTQEQAALATEQDKCARQQARDGSGVWKMDGGQCVSATSAASSNSGTGDCANASLFNGSLKGQNCQDAASTIKDVTAQQDATTAATTAATQLATSAYAQQSTGAQSNSQVSQANIMKAMAIAKLGTGGLALVNAMRLKSAASDAEDAQSAISGKQKELSEHCDQVVKISQGGSDDAMSMDQCFARDAASYGIDPAEATKANFDRMRDAAAEAQTQADKANSAAKAAMIQGLADAAVGAQAYQLANQANNNAVAGTTAGVAYATPSYALTNAGSGGSMSGFGTTAAAQNADAGVAGTAGNAALAIGPNQIQGSLMTGKGFGVASTPTGQGARSGVSTGAGGGGAGGGGGGGGGSGAKGPKGKSNNNTIGGEYVNAGSLQMKPPSGGKDKDAANPFADALAKLFPKDTATGAPVVDTRQLASDPQAYDDVVTGAEEGHAAELSIFEQITTKYRQMSSNGQI